MVRVIPGKAGNRVVAFQACQIPTRYLLFNMPSLDTNTCPHSVFLAVDPSKFVVNLGNR